MVTLQLSQSPAGDGRHTVQARLSGTGVTPVVATSEFALTMSAADRERVRWYLEDYLEYPIDPAPAIAATVEQRMAELGADLFQAVFSSTDGQRLWARVEQHLPQMRVEVASSVEDATALPWELLRDPHADTLIALRAQAFVRVNHSPALPSTVPKSSGGPLRVLLVICRPGGRADVPFRSVAGHLINLGPDADRVLDLHVLRPPTFETLTKTLEAAHTAGQPFHVVHFDGHGDYLTTANGGGENTAGQGGGGHSPHRYGGHGYLLFEDPQAATNVRHIGGSELGEVLARTGVGTLVLNACRSAYADAPPEPQTSPDPAAEPAAGSADDSHARIRAYGSLALEVTDKGVAGVVAMRYSVYVVTAAQFITDVYTNLIAGQPLGVAVSAARRQLAAQPHRSIAFTPRQLQDWSVPVVYETSPITLFAKPDGPPVQLTVPDRPAPQLETDDFGLPPAPDVGFFGRDETLLALDRAFDNHKIVLLYAYAGAGKTSTAVEFARWYTATGGLADPTVGHGLVVFSSLEHHTPLARLLTTIGDAFGPLLAANGVLWHTLDDSQRRDVALQLVRQVPVLWIWDNVEPVAGFPTGSPSVWTQAEQGELRAFLGDLSRTQARVLLTSRRDEHDWLGDLPVRVTLPAMPMRERIQLTQALAERHRHRITDVEDWRPLLRYTAGNPLTITVLVGQALRAGVRTRAQVDAFVAQLRSREANLDDDAAQGRSKSLGASLAYGFTTAFTEQERAQLAVLHLFHDTVNVDTLVLMGAPEYEDALAELAGLTPEAGIGLLDRAAEIGLLSPLGSSSGFYTIHPALPWYFTQLFTSTYGPAGSAQAQRVARAYTTVVANLGHHYLSQYEQGRQEVIAVLAVEEANLLHAQALARRRGQWGQVIGCMQGLRVLYQHTGRRGEWARLVDELVPDLVDPATDQPLPGREQQWSVFVDYRVRLARAARDFDRAATLQHAVVAWDRDRAAGALAVDPDQLTDQHRNAIHTLAVSVHLLATIRRDQQQPDCVDHYAEAAALYRRIGDRRNEAVTSINLGNAYLDIPALRDVDQAELAYQRSLDLYDESDRNGRANATGQLGQVAHERFLDARTAGQPAQVLRAHLNAAASRYHQALGLFPDNAPNELATVHNALGTVYADGGRTDTALDHYQQAIHYYEAAGDRYRAGVTRFNVALALDRAGRTGDALLYAHAALRDLEPYGRSAATVIDKTRALITRLERKGSGVR